MRRKKAAALTAIGLCAVVIVSVGSTRAWFSDKSEAVALSNNAGVINVVADGFATNNLPIWPAVSPPVGNASDSTMRYWITNKSGYPASGKIEISPMAMYVLPLEAKEKIVIQEEGGSTYVIEKGAPLFTEEKLIAQNGSIMIRDRLLTDDGYKYGEYVVNDYLKYYEEFENGDVPDREPLYKTYYDHIVKDGYRSELLKNVRGIAASLGNSPDIALSYDGSGGTTGEEFPFAPLAKLKTESVTLYFVMDAYNYNNKEPFTPLSFKVLLESGNAKNQLMYSVIEPVSGVEVTATQARDDDFIHLFGEEPLKDTAFMNRIRALDVGFEQK